jgi:hypothetical protein
MDLKQKVQEIRPNKLSSFAQSEIFVWKLKSGMIIKNLTPRRLSEILGKIDINDKDIIERVEEDEKVANLGPSYGETLLLQLPGMSHISTITAAFSYSSSCHYRRQPSWRSHHDKWGPRK